MTGSLGTCDDDVDGVDNGFDKNMGWDQHVSCLSWVCAKTHCSNMFWCSAAIAAVTAVCRTRLGKAMQSSLIVTACQLPPIAHVCC